MLLLTLVGLQSQNTVVGQGRSMDILAMGLFAIGFVSMMRAACIVCRSPSPRRLR